MHFKSNRTPQDTGKRRATVMLARTVANPPPPPHQLPPAASIHHDDVLGSVATFQVCLLAPNPQAATPDRNPQPATRFHDLARLLPSRQ